MINSPSGRWFHAIDDSSNHQTIQSMIPSDQWFMLSAYSVGPSVSNQWLIQPDCFDALRSIGSSNRSAYGSVRQCICCFFHLYGSAHWLHSIDPSESSIRFYSTSPSNQYGCSISIIVGSPFLHVLALWVLPIISPDDAPHSMASDMVIFSVDWSFQSSQSSSPYSPC